MYKNTPFPELQERIACLQRLMVDSSVSAALIIQRADMFYFSGTAQDGYLLVPFSGLPHLLIRKNFERARQESKLKLIEPLQGWDHLRTALLEAAPRGNNNGVHWKIGLELDVLPVNLYLRLKKLLPEAELIDISPAVKKVRSIKSPYEIELIKKAAALSEQMFDFAQRVIREGMTELMLATCLEAFVRSRGHQGGIRLRGFNQELFYGHILSGENGVVPTFFDGPTGGPGVNPSYPIGAGYRTIATEEPILLDFVTVLDGYMVDQTRMFWLGKLPDDLYLAYRTAREINRRLAPLGKPGSSSRGLYQLAQEIAKQAGLNEHFMGYKSKVSFIGHGVGLELDELPVIAGSLDFTLQEGMVFTLEPKFIFPQRGTVGIEDTFVVRPHGLEQLTRG